MIAKIRASIFTALVLVTIGACDPGNPPKQIVLLRAASEGDTTKIRECLQAEKPDINWRAGGNDITPLIAAVEGGHLAAVSLLLDYGADPNIATSDGYSALHAAASFDDAEVSRRLIAAGARVDARMEFGFTPLMIAARRNNLSVIEVLLRAGASRELVTSRGLKPLDIARNYGHQDAVRLLQTPANDQAATQPEFIEERSR